VKRQQGWRNGEVLIDMVWLAETATERMRGLLARPPLQAGEAMLITPCRMVHTFGMAYVLDLAFLDRTGRVRKLSPRVKPARMAGSFIAHDTLEMPAGDIDRIGLAVGDILTFR
jgi:hypothetical protein